jgi:iron complex outermembrane receptor protein
MACRKRFVGPLPLALFALVVAVPAWGQQGGAADVPPGVAQAPASTQAFDIPPQALGTALVRFSEATGIQLFMDSTIARGLQSPGVRGTMSRTDALSQLLAGSGLVYRFTNANTVTVEKPGAGLAPGAVALDPVQVPGAFPVPSQAMIDNIPPPYAGGQVAIGSQLGLLGNRGVMDTPFNQTSYTAKKTQDQQAKTIQEALIDDPSVRQTRPDSGPAADNVRIRGFDVFTGSISYGGLYGMLPTQSIVAEVAERVEVLKGPSAMLNGMQPLNAIGGAINVVPKRAPAEPLSQATASYISSAQFGGHIDFARRFGDDQQFGVRINGVFRAGQTEIQWNADQRALGVLGLDFRGDRMRFSLDLGYQYQFINGIVGYLGLANGVPLPWAPDVRRNVGGQPWNWQERRDSFGVFRGEFDIADHLTAYVSFGAHNNWFGGPYSSGVLINNPNGNATANAPFHLASYNTFRTAESGLRARAGTGPVDHELALTATTFESELGVAFTNGAAFSTPTNIYNPIVYAPPNIAVPVVNKTGSTTLSSFGVADTLSAADKRVQLTVGARLQRVAATNFNATTGAATSNYDQTAISPSVSLVVKPFWQNLSLYGKFIQGLQQGTIVGATFANAGEIFPPYKSTQYEAGVKVDWGKFATTASLFQITVPSTIANVTTNTLSLNGEQRNQGLELNVFGEPYGGIRLLGGAMFMSPVLAKTQGGLTDGWIAPFSPTFQFNLAGEWDLPFAPGLTLDGRLIYTGAQYIDTTWPRRSLPEWTRFDLGARYTFENPGAKGKLLVARFNVENVLDANYWAGGDGSANTLYLGMPRTFRLSLTADF